MTKITQMRLLLGLMALTCLTALIGAWMVSTPTARNVAVEGAFGWLDEDKPQELSLHIRLLNLKNHDQTVVGVAAEDGRAAALCRAANGCAEDLTATLAKSAETVLRPEEDAYVMLASSDRPFQDGEVTLIQLVLASGDRVPVDVKVRKR